MAMRGENTRAGQVVVPLHNHGGRQSPHEMGDERIPEEAEWPGQMEIPDVHAFDERSAGRAAPTSFARAMGHDVHFMAKFLQPAGNLPGMRGAAM